MRNLRVNKVTTEVESWGPEDEKRWRFILYVNTPDNSSRYGSAIVEDAATREEALRLGLQQLEGLVPVEKTRAGREELRGTRERP